MRNLTRMDIVSVVHEKCGISKTDSSALLEQLIDEIINALCREDAVKLVSFCNFQVRHKRARVGRNPKTKVNYSITRRKVVTAKFSRLFKDSIIHG